MKNTILFVITTVISLEETTYAYFVSVRDQHITTARIMQIH